MLILHPLIAIQVGIDQALLEKVLEHISENFNYRSQTAPLTMQDAFRSSMMSAQAIGVMTALSEQYSETFNLRRN